MSAGFGYSMFAVKKGQLRPSVILFQLTVNKLADVLSKPEWKLTPDGNAGAKTEAVIKSVQKHYALVDYNGNSDGIAGTRTWAKMVADLFSWRPPLRFRIAELQNTFENGNTSNCFGACNVVSFEGWHNYGVWNTNCMDGNVPGSSIGILLRLGGRTDLYSAVKEKDNSNIIDFLQSKPGVDVQLGAYMDQFILGPAAKWLRDSGFQGFDFEAKDTPDTLPLIDERLLSLSSDIAVNSGPAGYAPKRVPRRWDGSGEFRWDTTALPDRDACRAIFGEVFGVKLPTDPAEDFDHSVDTRATYLQALKRCLWEVCQDDEQRINLIADLQGRCIRPGNNLASMVLQRRRAVARKDGYVAQGSNFCLWRNFGIGI